MQHPSLLAAAGLAVALAGSPAAQVQNRLQEPNLMLELATWRAGGSNAWRVIADRETGFARMVWGGNRAAEEVPVSDADFQRVARRHVSEARALFGVEPANLVDDRVTFLPLGLVGTSDKLTVGFRQELDGVPVRHGFLSTLMDLEGRLLSLASTALPDVGAVPTTPEHDARAATEFAVARFVEEVGLAPTFVAAPKLWIEQVMRDDRRAGTLAWEIQLLYDPAGDTLEEGYRYLVAARGDLRVVTRENLVHQIDVGGRVVGMGSPGLDPDVASNPEVQLVMGYMDILSGAGPVQSDGQGNFLIQGVNGPVDFTFRCKGPFNDVTNRNGFTLNSTHTLTGTNNLVVLNNSLGEGLTAQVNVFHHINRMRDWIRGINPADGMMDFVNTANVNNVSNCNATYNGFATNYRKSGNGCPNTAYSTVIYHEQGHWLNDRYNTGNGSDGMGEGNADVYAIYQADSPIVAQDFFGPGTFIRTGNNTRQFCGDSNPGCHGGVHANGEVLMGAFWKMRVNLKARHGQQLGSDIANALHSGWMNTFNQRFIRSIIVTQLLALDDDNGNITDGTPHYLDVDAGFQAQGFPSVPATFVPSITAYGTGLNGANVGALSSSSTPAAGANVDFEVAGWPAGTPAQLLISFNQTNQPLVGGTLLVDLNTVALSVPFTVANGGPSLTLATPGNGAGITGFAQVIAQDAGQPAGLGFTNGLMIVIGG